MRTHAISRRSLHALCCAWLALAACSTAPSALPSVRVVVRDGYDTTSPARVDRYRLRVFRRDPSTHRWSVAIQRDYLFAGTAAPPSADAGTPVGGNEGRHQLLPDGPGDRGPLLVEAQGGRATHDASFVPTGAPVAAQFEFPSHGSGEVILVLDPVCDDAQPAVRTADAFATTCVAHTQPGGSRCPAFEPLCVAFGADGTAQRGPCGCGGASGLDAATCADAGAMACPDPVGSRGDGGTMDAMPGAMAAPGTLRDRGACTEACERDGNWSWCAPDPACGALGAACCGATQPAACRVAGACASNDLVCTASSARCAHCGGASEPCCAGAHCGADLVCASGACVACGTAGTPCCDGAHCGAGVVCASGACAACGALGAPCCDGAQCNGGLACSAGACVACGGRGATCCPGGGCGVGACDTASNTCQCGALGQRCCAGACDAGATCGAGDSCQCGGVGQPCCGGSGCAPAGVTVECIGGVCTPCGDGPSHQHCCNEAPFCHSVPGGHSYCDTGTCTPCGERCQTCCPPSLIPGLCSGAMICTPFGAGHVCADHAAPAC